MKDHYKILGISSYASIAEIKKAYRALAFKYHPDKNPGDEIAVARFREIKESYEILSDVSRKNSYDDDRWVSGMSTKTKTNEAVTPAWLLNVCIQLNSSLSSMDTHRMSQRALQAYIMLILEDAHIALLLQKNDTSVTHAIILELLKASKWLEVKYLDTIERKLITLAGEDNDMLQAIDEKMDERIRAALMKKLLPWFVIIITLVLCACMYYYGELR